MFLPHLGYVAYSPWPWSVCAKLLANALVSSCLDYCNSLLHGIVDTDLTKLQPVQNWLVSTVTKSPPLTCSVLLLLSLHWLPVKLRKVFEISLLTYKTLHEKQPVFLRSMLAQPLPYQSLLLNKRITLRVTRVKTNVGARAFYSCTSSLWNNLLPSVRSVTSVATFRKRLQTHLFDLVFPP